MFGVKYIPKGEDLIISHDDDEGSSDEMDNQGGRGLQHLLNQDVCFLISCSHYNTNSSLLFITLDIFIDGPLSTSNRIPETQQESAWINLSEAERTALVVCLALHV